MFEFEFPSKRVQTFATKHLPNNVSD